MQVAGVAHSGAGGWANGRTVGHMAAPHDCALMDVQDMPLAGVLPARPACHQHFNTVTLTCAHSIAAVVHCKRCHPPAVHWLRASLGCCPVAWCGAWGSAWRGPWPA